ncbi:MAG TPA: DUF2062 domain-containing protein [Steroidobacteraceae bacterium]|jgi:uncharacterized protein (DUF2062 family)|nr:DUF2062 domain-containing protein [Steroidobacteraceae bacterium]
MLREAWQRRVVDVVLAQLRQGITPQKIALTVAIGATLGLFPILGSTTLLCFLAGLLLKLNQPIIQAINYLVYPLQVTGIYFFIRVGEWLTRTPPLQFSIAGLLQQFRVAPLHFFQEFGMTALRGVLAWTLIAPFVAAALYFGLLPVLRRLARLRSPGVNVNVA